VAVELVAFRATVPLGFTHGAAQVTVKVAAPFIDATGSLNVALMTVLSGDTSVAWSAGATAVTVGADAGLPELHPAAKATSSTAVRHAERAERCSNVFIFVPLSTVAVKH